MAARLVAHVAYTAAVVSRLIEATDWISEARRAAIILRRQSQRFGLYVKVSSCPDSNHTVGRSVVRTGAQLGLAAHQQTRFGYESYPVAYLETGRGAAEREQS
jgi:hypothetical protein